ncbi:MAG TPA: histidine--tRNA ligase [Candidatus Caccomorpha excrementavium]|nr:histidine--tRNA ligase [Candidatus Caccomorpha excrementavium]
MKTTTVKGTNDYLPGEAQLRDYLQNVILNVYRSHGFRRIMTPVIEDAENLDKSEGGENLNLIFKILKRGEKLEKAIAGGKMDELSDMGLRYDLTLPLTRYYANNKDKLLSPFKCIQIDKVYRAERPQKGRLREFVQCDIDILGSSSWCCEVELIDVTAQALLAIGIGEFRIKINDRRILKNVLMNLGFTAEELDSVCITFDKLDKVGIEGVREELIQKGFAQESIDRLAEMLEKMPFTLETIRPYCSDEETLFNLANIMSAAEKISGGRYEIVFDISLVRGQGYYTGTIFEAESRRFKGAIGGGGRYDNLIGKFLNESVPAVGFSIGFERIFSILSENGAVIPDARKQIAVLYDEKNFTAAYEKAEELRKEYDTALFERPKKTGKFLSRLEEQGYSGFFLAGQSEEVQWFKQ